MPYIKPENRDKFEDAIKRLLDHLETKNGCNVGELNYVISSIVWSIFDSKPSYTLGNNLMGVLECVKQEFYRRRLAGYEDEKIQENGDI